MQKIKTFFLEIWEFFNIPLFSLGDSSITLWTIIYLLLVLFILSYSTAKLRRWIVYRILAKSSTDLGVRIAVGTIVRYFVLVIGIIIILQTVGIDLSTLTIIGGALGIGIGFGLQNVTNNFVSGLVILFERPIKVGDRIEVENVSGDVIRISMRATTILTNDNISIIVPNSEFISSKVINWSHIDRNVRLNFPVQVSYKEDPENIKKILLRIAGENQGILKDPKPDVLFDSFGESALNFNLRVWTREYTNRPGVLRSQLYYEIFKTFRREGIEIPFPQREVRLKNEELRIINGTKQDS